MLDFAKDLLERHYCRPNETVEAAFKRACDCFGSDAAHSKRLQEYIKKEWFMFSSPILSNAPAAGEKVKGLPISCFLTYVPDTIKGLCDHTTEERWLSVKGGGVGGHWSSVRAISDQTPGVNGFLHTVDADMVAYRQGKTRRGSYAAYMDVSHPEIEEFIAMRKTTGGDLNRKCLNLHNAVNITNEFLDAVRDDLSWRLIDPKTKTAVKNVSARDLWWQIIHTRSETGEPYIVNLDNCNDALPKEQKDLGLEIRQSNLCSEITLPTNEERTAVCCLSSVNLEKFDEWSTDSLFIDDLVTMLDNVIEHFIENAVDTDELGTYRANADRFKNHIKEGMNGYKKSTYSAYRERSIGLGAMGFHSYLQSKGIPFEGMYASSFKTERLTLSKLKQLTQVKDLLKKGAKHLIWLVADYVMLISWLLLLTLLVPLYVMVQALVLSLQGLMCILTKR